MRTLSVDGTTCQLCTAPCLTCNTTLDGCLTCIPTYFLTSLSPSNYCVLRCEMFSFPNSTSGTCQLCASVPALNCFNCSSASECHECDDPLKSDYVYLPDNSSCL